MKTKKLKFTEGVYVGEVDVFGRRHGKGVMKFKNGDVYDGEWNNGDLTGRGVMTYKNGDVYNGEMQYGKRNGYGVMMYSAGGSYSGEWENNMMHGRGVMSYVNGDVFEIVRSYDSPHGHGVMKYANGDVYEGEWRNDFQGSGTIRYTNGDVYYGEWESQRKIGHGIMKYANGDVYEGEWGDFLFKDELHGEGIYTYSDGRKEKRKYHAGKLVSSEPWTEGQAPAPVPVQPAPVQPASAPAPVQSAPAPSAPAPDSKVTDTLHTVVKQYGVSAFSKNGKATAMLGDLLPGQEYAKLRKCIKLAIDSGACEVLTNGSGDREFLINEAAHRLMDFVFMAEKPARETVTLLAEVLV